MSLTSTEIIVVLAISIGGWGLCFLIRRWFGGR